MCDDERAILWNIKANPDDDLPRLVYADWLEERGWGERAVDIREQCENPEPYKRECDFGESVWYRGFVCEYRCTMKGWLARGPMICEHNPVQRVAITDRLPVYISRQNQSDVYFWNPNAWPDPYASHIPFEIVGEDKFRNFDTSDAAHDWLSRRCIEWANEQAELVCRS
jgi:uncharacterized protein (TIGR02996 family)